MPRLPSALQKELGMECRAFPVATGHKRKRQTLADADAEANADDPTQSKRSRLETSAGFHSKRPTVGANHHRRTHAVPPRSYASSETQPHSSRLKATHPAHLSNTSSASVDPDPANNDATASSATVSSKNKPSTALERLAQKLQGKAGIASSSSSPTIKFNKSKLNQVERQEEDEIAWLEAKLGLRNKKKRNVPLVEDDGLDDLCDDLDRIVAQTRGPHAIADERHAQNSQRGLTFESEQGEQSRVQMSDQHEDISEEDGGDNDTSDLGSASLEGGDQDSSNEEDEAQDRFENAAGGLGFSDMESEVPTSDDDDPPAPTFSSISALQNGSLAQNADVTATLTDLVITSISSHSSLLDTFVVLHAALVASLHKILGVDFAAFFVQSVVDEYEKQYNIAVTSAGASEVDGELTGDAGGELIKGKEASNLLVLLAELYTFQVVSCVLMYDIIREFLSGDLSEFEVELFLKLLKSIGVRLRQDDPTALKEIVQLVQTKVAGQDRSAQSSRTRFMLETLTNLKNNKLGLVDPNRKVGHANGQMLAEAVERMRKFVNGIGKKRTVRGTEPLNVSLPDLRSADTKGKWWLVGSAWSGNPLVDRQEKDPQHAEDDDRLGLDEETRTHAEQSAALLKLAKKQGMNTDVRRSIFVVLMSSEDYVDACERLGHLKISDQQRPEVVRVLLHCLGNEKAYNPYYTLIVQHLSASIRNIRFSLQYCLWDLFREFGESIRRSSDDADDLEGEEEKSVSRTKLRNLARAYAWWVAKGAVALDVFKPLNFLALKSQTALFLRTFFAQLFVSAQSASPLLDFATEDELEVASLSRDREVLEVIVMKSIKSPSVVQGTMYFFESEAEEFVGMAKDDGVRKLIRWGVKVAKETLGTGGEVANLL
ncbi:suppressor of glycerol defect [Tulasnella sp. 424]|nr:suppressor of glycerol defect [Tulasnella sp. 424]